MRCTACDSPYPEDAAFCVACGVPVPATGRTVTLDQQRVPADAPVTADLPAPVAARPKGRRRRSIFNGSWTPFARGLSARSGAILLIGMGILFFNGMFWPGILAVIGITSAIDELGEGNVREAVSSLLLLGGMAVLFFTGTFWPGILVLLGLMALVDRATC